MKTESTESHLTGYGYGLALEYIAQKSSNKKSALLGVEFSNMENTANNSTESEKLKGFTVFAGARYYTGLIYLGARLIAGNQNLEVDLPSPQTSISRGYLDYAAGAEIGTDFKIGRRSFFSPSLRYQVGKLEPKSSSDDANATSTTIVTATYGFEF